MAGRLIETYVDGVLVTSKTIPISDKADRYERIMARIEQAIPVLEAATVDTATWTGLTAAQRNEVSRQAIFALAKLMRLVIKRFDVPE